MKFLFRVGQGMLLWAEEGIKPPVAELLSRRIQADPRNGKASARLLPTSEDDPDPTLVHGGMVEKDDSKAAQFGQITPSSYDWKFADFQAGGNGTIALLNAAKQKYGFKTMLSIGGWSASVNFSAVAVNPVARKTLAEQCVKACQDYGFDGVDLDWEYPGGGGKELNYFSLGDPKFYIELLKDLRAAFGSKYLISIDVSAANKRYDNKLWAYAEIVDWINIMAFGYVGSLQPISGHNSPLHEDNAGDPGNAGFVEQAVYGYHDSGVPAEKLTLLTPFYGKFASALYE
ncbi:glycoside hydrolase family 18 protein [Gonapodya prolifera JEL478]|uniref:Glycoside hydrolase family 18 protein n=1 Tax=Gonapodya prolifera (strain JEL478) TaxID=1344416 RepID=A0A139A2U6_GONPJ|nr:glycoside hydrolase family 18 protein [Gonapodya prolifera JEL478]|eukprot:KXS10825.1 glycoside hydrolase family 18 protein [Gonapodya prolifera JEL478]